MTISPADTRRAWRMAILALLSASGCGSRPGDPAAVTGSSCDTRLRASYGPDALACCRPTITEVDRRTQAAFPPPDAAYQTPGVVLPELTPLQRDCCALAIDVLDRNPPSREGYATPESSCCLYIEGAPGRQTAGPFCSPSGKPKPLR